MVPPDVEAERTEGGQDLVLDELHGQEELANRLVLELDQRRRVDPRDDEHAGGRAAGNASRNATAPGPS